MSNNRDDQLYNSPWNKPGDRPPTKKELDDIKKILRGLPGGKKAKGKIKHHDQSVNA